MRIANPRRLILLLLISLLAQFPGAAALLAQQPTTKAQRVPIKAVAPAPGAALACTNRVGILGNYFGPEMQAFLVANGLTATIETAASLPAALNNLDVLYINRGGTADAQAQAALIESWVRGGGVLITEFGATELLFNGTTFHFFSAATLDNGFAVPSGNVCGENTVNVTSPTNALAAGLPASWACSGDPIGVFKVYKESTLDPSLDRVARLAADQNNDGAKDPVVGTACLDGGAVVAFLTDFGDFTPLQNPRICPNASCNRSSQDETLMLNAVCRVKSNCRPQDHFLCYKVRPRQTFKSRKVRVHNQFGDQIFTVLAPDLLCVPSTKKEIR